MTTEKNYFLSRHHNIISSKFYYNIIITILLFNIFLHFVSCTSLTWQYILYNEYRFAYRNVNIFELSWRIDSKGQNTHKKKSRYIHISFLRLKKLVISINKQFLSIVSTGIFKGIPY